MGPADRDLLIQKLLAKRRYANDKAGDGFNRPGVPMMPPQLPTGMQPRQPTPRPQIKPTPWLTNQTNNARQGMRYQDIAGAHVYEDGTRVAMPSRSDMPLRPNNFGRLKVGGPAPVQDTTTGMNRGGGSGKNLVELLAAKLLQRGNKQSTRRPLRP